ncbi:MAG: sigma 54-interacting transcriptional regulator, partial [Acidobacteriia bacterium]|nr:sigma 54-interacting transcriptional regulator [Terriglobia bacterium]
THRNLEQRVREGLFREDLFYRLAVVPIHLAPLRDRREDIARLAEVFCEQVATELKMPRRRVSAEALQSLQQYQFPGNLRELKNLIERAYILTSNPEIGPEDLPVTRDPQLDVGDGSRPIQPGASSAPEHFDLTALLEQTEKDLILKTLSATGGAQAEAARRMGLSRSALAYKLNKYGIRSAD